jgi:RNA polymerase sigma factor (sigma-70 family)
MASPQARTLGRDLDLIFGGGRIAQSDVALLERFLHEEGEHRETAFEALVERHGPMVDRVCRRVLGDGHEAQDAFQAVFLVLARRAGSVRQRDSLECWLHGVALRVAARARARHQRTRAREQPRGGLAELENSGQVARATGDSEAEAVHQEIERLTAKFRAPIVLCYLEGLTHDEAALRLNWPVGTVRSRLARGRDQLRGRLVRRGLSASGAVAALAVGLGVESEAAAASGLGFQASSMLAAPRIAATARAACQYAAGRPVVGTLFSATSLILTREVLAVMTLQKLATLGLALLPAGIILTAGVVIGHEPRAGKGPQQVAAPAPLSSPAAAVETPKPAVPDPIPPALNLAALNRFQAQSKAYEEGRITIDRIIMASERLMEVQRLLTDNEVGRIRAIKDHVGRLKEIEDRERAELVLGRSTAADETEIREARLEAELRLKKALEPHPANSLEDLSRRLNELERRFGPLEKRLNAESTPDLQKAVSSVPQP